MPSVLDYRDIADVQSTLSSWDKCMTKTYCKWPVIVAIIVGSLIVLSAVLCIARCVCCAGEMACCCFKCCTCCCPSGRGSGHKRMGSGNAPPPTYPSSYAPPVNQQYQPHAPPAINRAPTYRGMERERPQFATFEVPSKPVNEDALPAMPSWGEARSTKVEVEEEPPLPEKKGDLEMDRLDHNGSVTNSAISGAAAVGAGRRSPARSPVHRSPTADSYGFPPGYQNDSFVSGAPQRSHPGSPGPYNRPYGQPRDQYRTESPVSPVQQHSLSPVYGAGYGRGSPNQGYHQSYGAPAPRHTPSPGARANAYHDPVEMPSPTVARQQNNYSPVRSNTPQYSTTTGSTNFEPPAAAAYPGQQNYSTGQNAYPGQQTYHAFQPGGAGS